MRSARCWRRPLRKSCVGSFRKGRRRPSLVSINLHAETPSVSLTGLLQCVGRLEALWSVGVATSEHGWTYPQPSSRLRILGLVHPFLGRSAVSNDLQLDDQVRVCFVSHSLIVGDILYNLRSCLDHLVHQLIVTNTGAHAYIRRADQRESPRAFRHGHRGVSNPPGRGRGRHPFQTGGLLTPPLAAGTASADQRPAQSAVLRNAPAIHWKWLAS